MLCQRVGLVVRASYRYAAFLPAMAWEGAPSVARENPVRPWTQDGDLGFRMVPVLGRKEWTGRESTMLLRSASSF